jgi:isopentenyl phosphate kinase
MNNLILIKLGGSVVTNKSKEYTAREENITRLAKEIRNVNKIYQGKIVIGHGAGSFAHTPASKYQTKKGLINNESLLGMSIVEDSARELNAIIIKHFLQEKIAVFPFSPASFLISDLQVYLKSYLDPVIKALEIGQLPIVYGDVVLDKTNGCTIFSTEKVLGVLAKELNMIFKIRMIYVTDVDGVYDQNKKTISTITNKNFMEVKKSILGVTTVDVTGGMLHKVEEALNLAKKYKIETLIINGNKPGNLKKAILGDKVLGTKIC